MKAQLEPILARTMELFAADDRVLAAFHTGSVGTPTEDKYSDVDPLLLVRAEGFEGFSADLPGLFREAGVEPLLWWPERGNTGTFRNFAAMFYHQDVLLQYDINLQAWSGGTVPVRASAVILDKAGVLEPVEQIAPQGFDSSRLTWTIELYWIYVYIHAKYLLRGDPFRLAAAQQELLSAHLHVLHALKPEQPLDWWPLLARRVTGELGQDTLLTYLGESTAPAVAARLPAQFARFSRDAREACGRWGQRYPEAVEEAIARDVQGAIGRTLGG